MGIMQTEIIFATLLAAAAFLKKPVQDLVTGSLRDAYDATKAHLRKKFGENSEAANALDMATAKPESLIRKALLVEESASSGLCADAVLHGLIDRLASLLPASVQVTGPCVRVSGSGNSVQVAGRDLIHTAKHIQRNTITPDERHLSVEQREQIKSVISELAARLAGDDGAPNFAGAHRMLQRRYNVASYLLLPRERFADALAFLKQQRAIHRSRLLRRNPVAYRNDFFRAIFAGARELGWEGERVYQFATEALALGRPVVSLKELGPVQLKSLAGAVQRRVACARADGAR
jgi:hypothetical protein